MYYLKKLMSHFQDDSQQNNLQRNIPTKAEENNSVDLSQRDKPENTMLLIEPDADALKDYITSIPDLNDSINQLTNNLKDETKEHSGLEIAKLVSDLCGDDNFDHLIQNNVRDKNMEHNVTEIVEQIPDRYDTLYHLTPGNVMDEIKEHNDIEIATQISVTDINEETLLKDILDVINGDENLAESKLNDNVDEANSSVFANNVNNSAVHDEIEDVFNLDEFDNLMDNTDISDYDLTIKPFKVLRNIEDAGIVESLHINRTSTQIIDSDLNVVKKNAVKIKTDDPNIYIDNLFELHDYFTESGHKPEENMCKTDVYDNMENSNGINKLTAGPNTINNQNIFTKKYTARKTEQIVKNIHQVNEDKKEIVIEVNVEIKSSSKTDDYNDNVNEETKKNNDSLSVISINSSVDIELETIIKNSAAGENKVLENDNCNIIEICESSDEENVTNTTESIDSLKYLNVERDSDHCNGYNSSDFEFISKSEAEKDGLILDYYSRKLIFPDIHKIREVYTEEIAIESSSQDTIDMNLAGTSKGPYNNVFGPSNSNRHYYAYNTKYRHVLVEQEPDYKQNHRIPENDDYLNLFQGCFAPIMAGDLENKCTETMLTMNIEYEGVGFDMRLKRNEENEEYKDEAEETGRKIASLYPTANRKRRRRF